MSMVSWGAIHCGLHYMYVTMPDSVITHTTSTHQDKQGASVGPYGGASGQSQELLKWAAMQAQLNVTL